MRYLGAVPKNFFIVRFASNSLSADIVPTPLSTTFTGGRFTFGVAAAVPPVFTAMDDEDYLPPRELLTAPEDVAAASED